VHSATGSGRYSSDAVRLLSLALASRSADCHHEPSVSTVHLSATRAEVEGSRDRQPCEEARPGIELDRGSGPSLFLVSDLIRMIDSDML